MYNAKESLNLLMEGNQRFVENKTERPNSNRERRLETLNSQHPFAVVICCSDSRIIPEMAFDRGIGDLFVIRVAGNILTDEVIASASYAVNKLGTKLVMVLGHQNCGAVAAAKGGKVGCEYINSLIDRIEPNVKETSSQEEAEMSNVKSAVRALQELDEKTFNGKFSSGEAVVQGAYYSLETGAVSLVD